MGCTYPTLATSSPETKEVLSIQNHDSIELKVCSNSVIIKQFYIYLVNVSWSTCTNRCYDCKELELTSFLPRKKRARLELVGQALGGGQSTYFAVLNKNCNSYLFLAVQFLNLQTTPSQFLKSFQFCYENFQLQWNNCILIIKI